MPKNKGAGGKNRKKGKNENDDVSDRELIFKEDGQEYGQVKKMLGGGQIEAYCTDDVNRRCHIRGNMFKKVWISVGDIILINVREYERGVGDVIHKYLPAEVKNLKVYGELPENMRIDNTNTNNNNDEEDNIFFDNDSDDE